MLLANKRNKPNFMIRNYVTALLRYTSRNKVFTFINISGLSMGMMACMLISQYVVHEFSYDNFLTNKDKIFRVQQDRYNKGELTTRWAGGCAGIGPDLKANFPEVKYMTRLTSNYSLFSYGDVSFKEEGTVHFASEDFFKVFSIKLIDGIDSLVLKEPFKMVVSQSFARRYFGESNPVGKILKNNGKTDYEIVGVFEDLPKNTHMKIEALLSFSSFIKLVNDPLTTWNWDGYKTYIMLNDNADARALEAKLPAFVHKLHGADLKADNADVVFHLQPVDNIHLDSNFFGEFKPNGNRQSTYFLSIVAALILVIAWINFVNLSTAKSIERAREVGVRKVMGSFKSQLIQQFLFESLILNIFAAIIAIALVLMLTPWFGELTGRPLENILFEKPVFWLWICGFIGIGTLVSGMYPAFVLSGYKPMEVLKGRFKNTNKGVYFRKGMVVTQLITSITLIAGTFTVYLQINYMKNQSLGVNINQTLIMNSPMMTDSTYGQKFGVFKQQLLLQPEVTNVSASNTIPGGKANWNAGGIRRLSQREDEANQYRVIMMDHDFIKLYGLEIIAGRPFSGELTHEDKNVLINESASRLLGYKKIDEALNDQIYFWGDTFKIVGVLKDYHQESLKEGFDPMVFRYSESPEGFYSIRFNTSNVKTSIAKFEASWKEIFPGNPFSYFFLDDHYNQQYQADQQFGKVFGIFSLLAIFIACLGLFGLSSLTAIQRTKEIGVRKVLGATIPGILTLISKDYIKLMVIAIFISIPVSWWLMNLWLQDFASRIALRWWIFALPGLLIVLLALLTVSIHTVRVAIANPAKSLRYE
jgi:putative ABC transport system permease protein